MHALTLAMALLAVLGSGLGACTEKSKPIPVQTLRLAATDRITGFDPALAQDENTAREISRAYEGLYHYSYFKRPYSLAPAIAEALPEVSPDRFNYVVRLKKGVVFHDDPSFLTTAGKGRELTAEDVVFSLKRLADPALNSPARWIWSGHLEHVKSIDRYTVSIRLKHPWVRFPHLLTSTQLSIVPREAVEFYGKDFGLRPVGTGPFRLEEFVPESKLVWVRNPTYRREVFPADGSADDRGKLLPLAERIEVRVMSEAVQLQSFAEGKLDHIEWSGPTPIPPELKPTRRIDPSTSYLAIALPDREMRRALGSHSWAGRAALKQSLGDFAVLANGPVPPGMPGYRSMPETLTSEFSGENLATTLTIRVPSENEWTSWTERLTTSWAEDGIRSTIQRVAKSALGTEPAPQPGELRGGIWRAQYADAENLLLPFYGAHVENGINRARYQNPEFDRRYLQLLATPDGPARSRLIESLVQTILDDGPWIFGTHRVIFALSQSWLRNESFHDFDAGRAKYYKVDPKHVAR